MPRPEDVIPVRTVTVQLIATADQDLRNLCQYLELSETDAINRAISLYAYVTARSSAGDDLLFRSPAGEVERVRLID